ncbi:MAG TPA: NUDIX domain-containing protein, partial [Candidatus Saccharimonadales bacterium]|nr:NUDIX domain-containing protein [Candidatus Saccharimonadales bacterium]
MTAAIRETEEETGIKVTNLSLGYTHTDYLTSENTSVIRLLYITRLSETPAVKLSWEHSDYAWVPLKDLPKAIRGRRFFREAIEYCIEHGLI